MFQTDAPVEENDLYPKSFVFSRGVTKGRHSDFWSLPPFHEMDRYRWNILGLCEMRWKNFGETTTEEGHRVFFSGKEDKHEHGVGFFCSQ